jgi:hypothetical protein
MLGSCDLGFARPRSNSGIPAGFALLVFAACLVGIYSRLPGTLAVFWPANALLLGVLVRCPSTATVTTAWPRRWVISRPAW